MLAALTILVSLPLRPLAHESPVDHVDRGIRIWIKGDSVFLRYQLQLSERAAMMQLIKIDENADGVASESERDSYFAAFAEALSKQLHLQIDGKMLNLKSDRKAHLLPQFRQVFTFSGTCGALPQGKHAGQLNDDYSRSYPGMYRWDGAKFESGAGPRVTAIEAPKAIDAVGHAGSLQLKFEVNVP